MFTGESWYLHDERQYQVFVNRINMNLDYNPLREKPFDFYERYFFCTFCNGGLVQLNPLYTRFLFLKLSSFQKIEESFNAIHYYQVFDSSELANEKFCRQTNTMYLYTRKLECQPQVILFHMIVSASGINIPTKPYVSRYYDYKKMPQIFLREQYDKFEEPFKYSSPVFREYEYPSIIYCLNLERATFAETNMWTKVVMKKQFLPADLAQSIIYCPNRYILTKYVPMDIWGLVGLCLVILAILKRTYQKIKFQFLLENVLQFVSSFLKLIRIFMRQSWRHKWGLLGVLELFLSVLICVYENSITVNVVVPLVPKAFLNTKELYDNNYTFVVQELNFNTVNSWLSKEYNRMNHHKVIEVDNFFFLG